MAAIAEAIGVRECRFIAFRQKHVEKQQDVNSGCEKNGIGWLKTQILFLDICSFYTKLYFKFYLNRILEKCFKNCLFAYFIVSYAIKYCCKRAPLN